MSLPNFNLHLYRHYYIAFKLISNCDSNPYSSLWVFTCNWNPNHYHCTVWLFFFFFLPTSHFFISLEPPLPLRLSTVLVFSSWLCSESLLWRSCSSSHSCRLIHVPPKGLTLLPTLERSSEWQPLEQWLTVSRDQLGFVRLAVWNKRAKWSSWEKKSRKMLN